VFDKKPINPIRTDCKENCSKYAIQSMLKNGGGWDRPMDLAGLRT
jgi:hypothetical protein